MVRIDVQIAPGDNLDVDKAVTTDLVQHVLQKRHARFQLAVAAAVQIDADLDPGLVGIALNLGLALAHCLSPVGICNE